MMVKGWIHGIQVAADLLGMALIMIVWACSSDETQWPLCLDVGHVRGHADGAFETLKQEEVRVA